MCSTEYINFTVELFDETQERTMQCSGVLRHTVLVSALETQIILLLLMLLSSSFFLLISVSHQNLCSLLSRTKRELA